jgi:glutaminase
MLRFYGEFTYNGITGQSGIGGGIVAKIFVATWSQIK